MSLRTNLMILMLVICLTLSACAPTVSNVTSIPEPTEITPTKTVELQTATATTVVIPVFDTDSCLMFSNGQFAEADGDVIPTKGFFTVEMWVYDLGDGGGYVEYISQGKQPGPFYLGTTESSNIIRAGDAWVDTGVVMPKETWTHLALVHYQTGGILFINGEEVASTSSGYRFGDAGSPTRLGSQFGVPSEFFTGCLDEVKIFDSTRTAEQIKNDMERGVDPTDPNLVAYYDFNDTSDPFVVKKTAGKTNHQFELLQEAVWASSETENLINLVSISSEIGLSNCSDSNCGAYFHTNDVSINKNYQSGIGFYATIWPMLTETPSASFQMGLGSTWINPDLRNLSASQIAAVQELCNGFGEERGNSQWVLFQSVEGGFGYWSDTRFKSVMPKWRFNSTTDCYQTPMRSSPGWPFGGAEALPITNTGLVQLSNRMLIVPDGQTFSLDTNGEMLGIAWMALPFPQVAQSYNQNTGSNAWTLFVNSTNFKGPLAYYLPQFFSDASLSIPGLQGMGLDVMPAIIGGMASEVGFMPMAEVKDSQDVTYSRIPQLQFPVDEQGRTVFVQDLLFYSDEAIANQFSSWLTGSADLASTFNPAGAVPIPMSVSSQPEFYQNDDIVSGLAQQVRIAAWDAGTSFGLQWTDTNSNGLFPTYLKDEGSRRIIITEEQVPAETGLVDFSFENKSRATDAYIAGEWWNLESSIPGDTVTLTDGSTVTYVWIKFVDQPAFAKLNLSEADKQILQSMVENIHSTWKITDEYLAPPTSGSLVTFDPALLVTPPAGLEVGYVPLVISQTGNVVAPPLP
jgi:hypothetical protein